MVAHTPKKEPCKRIRYLTRLRSKLVQQLEVALRITSTSEDDAKWQTLFAYKEAVQSDGKSPRWRHRYITKLAKRLGYDISRADMPDGIDALINEVTQDLQKGECNEETGQREQ